MQLEQLVEVLVGWVMVFGTLLMVKILWQRDPGLAACERENEKLRKELKEETERLRQYYETLLRDASIRNAMMVGLWEAYRRGDLEKCYRDAGKVRVLADGTVICDMVNPEESYTLVPDVGGVGGGGSG